MSKGLMLTTRSQNGGRTSNRSQVANVMHNLTTGEDGRPSHALPSVLWLASCSRDQTHILVHAMVWYFVSDAIPPFRVLGFHCPLPTPPAIPLVIPPQSQAKVWCKYDLEFPKYKLLILNLDHPIRIGPLEVSSGGSLSIRIYFEQDHPGIRVLIWTVSTRSYRGFCTMYSSRCGQHATTYA